MSHFWTLTKIIQWSRRNSRYSGNLGAITDGGYVSPAEIAEIAEIGGPSQMAGFYVGRLKARNYSKFDSKLYKIDSTEMIALPRGRLLSFGNHNYLPIYEGQP